MYNGDTYNILSYLLSQNERPCKSTYIYIYDLKRNYDNFMFVRCVINEKAEVETCISDVIVPFNSAWYQLSE